MLRGEMVYRALVLWLALGCLVAGMGPAYAGAGESLYRFSPAPSWVKPAKAQYDAPLPAGGVSEGRWELLSDRQIALTPQGYERYSHFATKVLTASGVDSASQIDVSVDPGYQVLLLHSVHVIRKGVVLDHSQDARITALPEETELRARIYNGRYRINILLPDVRMGDVLDYAFTVRSTESLFPGHFFTYLPETWEVPLHYQRVRIVAPAGARLSFRATDGLQPHASVHGGLKVLEWEWHDLAAVTAEAGIPDWYSPWSHIEVSNATGWGEIARRVRPLFEMTGPQEPVAQVVADIRRQGGPPLTQALHALQFVQEQIRYVSISIGRGAYRPASPATVLQRRFGDCKDKTLLLVTLLRGLGIQAQPALVHSRRGHVLEDTLPTPYAFDHAIVRMQLGSEVFWLDGTADTQHSPLRSDAPADFERALVLAEGTTGLSEIPRPSPDASRKRSEVLMDLRAGIDKPAKLTITTYYYGRLADEQRQDLANQSTVERQQSYTDYIRSYYPGARLTAPIAIQDDPAAQVLTVEERYALDVPFIRSSRGLRLLLQADELYAYLEPLKPTRTSPLALHYPAHVQQTIRTLLPQRWAVTHHTVTIDNPAFQYRSAIRYSEADGVPQLMVDYHYESRASFVDVAALPTYQADRRRAYDDSGYALRPPAFSLRQSAGLGGIAQPAALTGLLSLALWVYLAVRYVLHWDPPPPPAKAGWPVGIRGWLLLPALLVVAAPFADGSSLYPWLPYLTARHWAHLTETVPAPFAAWAPLILLGLTAFSVLLLVSRALLIYLFFSRRSSAPWVFIAVQWLVAMHMAALLAAMASAQVFGRQEHGGLAAEVFGSMLLAAVLTAYMLSSRRVRATFTRRATTHEPAVGASAEAACIRGAVLGASPSGPPAARGG